MKNNLGVSSKIKELFAQDDAFSMSVEMIGINGLCSPYQTHVLKLEVVSKPFLIDGREYKIFSNIRGSFSIILKEDFKQDNNEIIMNMFNMNSEKFAFNLNDFNNFSKAIGDYKPLITCTDKRFNLYDLSVTNSDIDLINSAFKKFTKEFIKEMKANNNKKLNNFKAQFELEK